MAERNRTDLKTYFQIGKRPTQEQFADFIDSVLSKLDDGISISENNVGIGTNNPSTRLEVVTQDSWNIPPFRIGSDDSNEPAVDFKSGTDSFSIAVNNGTTNAFKIDHSAIENSLVIRDIGNIGIGITAPNAKLHIRHGDSGHAPTNSPGIFIENDGITNDGYVFQTATQGGGKSFSITNVGYIGIGTTAPQANLHVRHSDSGYTPTSSPGVFIENNGTSNNSYVLQTATQGGGKSFSITNAGNIGIGTDSPQAKLHIIGGSDVDLLGSSGSLIIGNNNSTHIAIDNNEIMAKSNATTATALTLQAEGGATHLGGSLHYPASDYAEYFESENGKAIPIGTAVTIGEHGKIRPAQKGETPIGIVSATPGVVGNSPREWPGKYLRDAFGQVVIEEYEEDEYIPKAQKTAQKNPDGTPGESKEEVVPATDGQPVLVKSGKKLKKQRKKRNPEYDESKPYVLREDREEWCCIGLLGQLPLRKDQAVAPTWVKLRELSDQADLWLVK